MNCPICEGSVLVDDHSEEYYALLICQDCGKTTVQIIEPEWVEELNDEQL